MRLSAISGARDEQVEAVLAKEAAHGAAMEALKAEHASVVSAEISAQKTACAEAIEALKAEHAAAISSEAKAQVEATLAQEAAHTEAMAALKAELERMEAAQVAAVSSLEEDMIATVRSCGGTRQRCSLGALDPAAWGREETCVEVLDGGG